MTVPLKIIFERCDLCTTVSTPNLQKLVTQQKKKKIPCYYHVNWSEFCYSFCFVCGVTFFIVNLLRNSLVLHDVP